MSISSSIQSISTKLPQFNLFFSSSKPLISIPLSSSSLPSSFKSISFQRIPTKTQSLSFSPSSSSSSSVQPVEELPPKLQEIVKLFQAAQDPRAKYQQLMFYANNLPPLQEKFKTKENKVEGCVSQVWVRAFLDSDSDSGSKLVYFEADSDSVMTKGLAALLVLGLSGRPVPEILRVSPDFVTLLGLHQNLTPSRNNGFLNMLKLMQRKALLLGLEDEKIEQGDAVSGLDSQLGADNLEPKLEFNGSSGGESSDLDVGRREIVANESNSNSGLSGVGLGSRGERIREKLERELKPVELDVEDISYQHAGHAGVKGSDGETHFNLKIVSNEFEGKSLVKRHRMIYGLLQDELEGGLHALSIIAKTPTEVDEGR
ncbi:sufE-like protein 1, chloroplastic/mitochondrial [Chenopodium quinoa]|uniref:sufE-like protein 1, chloroplastic/mitochondrial n=1 Tax=Chenopodium quinoa TaxID=63459 RepID=UPI000B779C24|nr:sufE-like protein 1, chloroplastic/mitochondrial [Chenopodium quinoa]